MHSVGFASCCAAAFAWLLFSPPPTHLRLSRLAAPQAVRDQGIRERFLEPVVAVLESVRERQRTRQRWRQAVIELCDGMASELAAGRTPDEAFTLTAALLDPPIAAQLLDAPARAPNALSSTGFSQGGSGQRTAITTRVSTPHKASPADSSRSSSSSPALFGIGAGTGTDPPEVRRPPRERLEKLAQEPGAEGLRLLAACWRIAAEQGGTLAAVLDDLATALRDEEANRQEIATQLAGPRATARLLSALPLLGLGMAAALDANPVAFLLGTLPGLGCLFFGVALNLTGLWWTHRLAIGAEEIS